MTEHDRKKVGLVVGLGNPGIAYVRTRHNAGFMVVNEISDVFNISLNKRKFDILFGRGFIEDSEIILAKPMTFMNRSGPSVQKLAHYYRIPCQDVLVIHDDIDLIFGRLKIKDKGGHGGHKGIRSLIEAFGEGDFSRLRLGIDSPGGNVDVSDYVLSKFNPDEQRILDKIITRARDSVVTIINKGIKEGMNQVNSSNMLITD